jgi:hypothetical protein
MTKESVTNILVELGKRLGFRVGTEIQASASAWVDVVWFDDRFDYGPKKGEKWSNVKTWLKPVLPVAGFEIEASAGAKPLKGSVANLNDLGALMSVVVISEENLTKMRKKGRRWSNEKDESIWQELRKRTLTWIHEARPTVRVVVMTEPEVKEWAINKGLTL